MTSNVRALQSMWEFENEGLVFTAGKGHMRADSH